MMMAVGDLVILVASAFVATLFWAARQRMGRAVEGTRLISVGLFILAVSAAFDASEVLPMVGRGINEVIGYSGYTVSCAFLVIGFVRWLPLLARLDGEVAGRARAEAELQAALERARRFNTGLEALGAAHMLEGWNQARLCDETAERLSTLLGCERVSIWRLAPDGAALECTTLFDARRGAHEAGLRLERSVNPDYFEAIESGAVICANDAASDPATRAFGPTYLSPMDIGALLDAPIRTGRGIHGVVCCEQIGRTRSWSPEEIALVSAAAQYVAVAYLADNAETLADELKQALSSAEAASAAKSVFVANMSHELRTPLNGVLGMARALADETSGSKQRGHDKVEAIIESGEVLLSILNDVLDLSKIEAGGMQIRPTVIDPAHIVEKTTALFRPAATQKGLELTITADHLPALITADGVRVRQVLSNLVANAVKFTEAGAVTVDVQAQSNGDGWRFSITVEDTGCGISATDCGRLFKRFSQVDQSYARKHGGAGLGLVIARDLARRMGGDITLDSTPGEGSRFTFTFHAEAGVQAHDAGARDAAPEQLDGLRVLLVDDNETNRVVARCFIEPFGAVVSEAAGGREALALFDEQNFDLVLLDAHMPGMNGLAVLEHLRRRPAGAGIPVIALTADALAGDKARYLAAGMDGYVAKPVDKNTLVAACARLAAGRSSADQDEAGAKSA